jgi:hypothetical protein
MEHIPFSIKSVVEYVHEALSYSAEEKGLEFSTAIDEHIPQTVSGDPFRLGQVLMNLCSNAIKFTEKGSVLVSAEVVPGNEAGISILFAIKDTGNGIPADKLSGIFDHFTQANRSDTRVHGGTGLGLSISKDLVALMGGEITVQSAVASGSTFCFTLPFVTMPGDNEAVAQPSQKRATLPRELRILLAEDNEYNRMLVIDALKLKADVHIDIACTGKEAVALAGQSDYDVILMDVQMPEMSGIDATHCIRDMFPPVKKDIPIIALTAGTQSNEFDICLQAGMNAIVIKPFDIGHLIDTIVRVVERKETSMAIGNWHEVANAVSSLPNTGLADLSYLESFCESDGERVKQYIDLYIKAVPAFKEKIAAAICAGDNDAIAIHIHSFKPKWVMMGMKKINMLATRIESELPGNNKDIYLLVDLLIEETERSATELAKKIIADLRFPRVRAFRPAFLF